MGAEAVLHGLVENTNEQYHSGPGISKSMLDAIAVSPLNCWDQYINPDREPREYKHCFAVGDGTHKIVLEPGTFEQTYAVGFDKTAFPDALATTDDLKQALRAENLMTSGNKPELARRLIEEAGYDRSRILMYLEEDHRKKMGSRIPIPARDYRDMMHMLRAINRHHTAGRLLSGAYVEQSYYLSHESGLLLKCRPDVVTYDGSFIVDLKTTDDVSAAGFGRTIAQRRYHVQAAWYLDILAALYSDAPRGFAFIAAQKNRPYDVAVHILTADQIELGRRIYQRDLALLMQCMERDEWLGADGGKILVADLPRWEMNKLEYGL